MEHEKIYRREDGSRVKIQLSLFNYSEWKQLDLSIAVCDKGKRTWYIPEYNEWDYRRSKDRDKYLHDLTKDLYTPKMIAETKAELVDKVRELILNLEIKNYKHIG